jgi:hypothetical protein
MQFTDNHKTFAENSTAYRCNRCTKLVRFSDYFGKTFQVDATDHSNIMDGHRCRKKEKREMHYQ